MRPFPFLLILSAMVLLASCSRPETVVPETEPQTESVVPSYNLDSLANGHEYVDLGICDHLLWATTNVGAESPEQTGDFFMWGDTLEITERLRQQRDDPLGSIWHGYPYLQHYISENGESPRLSKYNTGHEHIEERDGYITLQPEDDAAHVHWGGGWRMPDGEELEELLKYCESRRDTLNGRPGYRFYGRGECVGNSIFLPLAGAHAGYSHLLYNKGGYYWSRTVMFSGHHNGVGALVNDENMCLSFYFRYYGQTIRPVMRPGEVLVSQVRMDTTSFSVTLRGDTVRLSAEVYPANASKPRLHWFSSDDRIAEVDSLGRIFPYQEGVCYISAISTDGTCCRSTCMVKVVDPSHPEHELIDLNIGNHLRWATMNVGAESPADHGDYFTWEEACRINWGDHWRLPTSAEMQTLLQAGVWTWSEEDDNGGYRVSGNILDGTFKVSSFFLPAAGQLTEDGISGLGEAGYYWCSDHASDLPGSANSLSFSSRYHCWTFSPAQRRFPIRLVYDPR